MFPFLSVLSFSLPPLLVVPFPFPCPLPRSGRVLWNPPPSAASTTSKAEPRQQIHFGVFRAQRTRLVAANVVLFLLNKIWILKHRVFQRNRPNPRPQWHHRVTSFPTSQPGRLRVCVNVSYHRAHSRCPALCIGCTGNELQLHKYRLLEAEWQTGHRRQPSAAGFKRRPGRASERRWRVRTPKQPVRNDVTVQKDVTVRNDLAVPYNGVAAQPVRRRHRHWAVAE